MAERSSSPSLSADSWWATQGPGGLGDVARIGASLLQLRGRCGWVLGGVAIR